MRVNDYFDAVYVINLDRRTDRMERLDTQLKNLGIEYKRFSAVDALEENIPPYIAGKLSHQKVLEQLNGQKALILEDDALFVEGFQESFDEVMEYLPSDWDVFYLGVLLQPNIGKLIQVNKHWYRQVVSVAMHSYCVNPNQADFFASELDKYDGWVDVCFRLLADKTKAYVVQPNLVTQFPSFSDLRLTEVDDF